MMQYELDTLTQLISGSLSLTYTRRSDLTHQRHYLHERFPLCMKHYAVDFTYRSAQWQIVSFERCTQEQLYELPMAFPEKHYPSLLDSEYAYLLERLISYFNLPSEDVEWTTYQKEGNKLVVEIIILSDFQDIDASEVYFHYYQTMLYEEGEKIKEQWAKVIFSLHREQEIKLYVQNHQRALDRLRSQVKGRIRSQEHHRLHVFSPTFTLEDTYKAMYVSLDELMQHLEHQYGTYVDDTACLSFRSRLQAYNELSRHLNKLQEQLQVESISHAFRQIVEKPLKRFKQLLHIPKLTYRELVYGRQLLVALVEKIEDPANEMNYIRVLMQEDFNDPDLLDYLTRQVLEDVEDSQDPISRLRYWIKFYRQLPLINPMSYQPDLPTLKVQLLDWLQEELAFQQDMEAESTTSAPMQLQTSIPIGLSVSQWAVLLRLLYEVGILQPKQQMDMLRTFSHLVSTRRVPHISVESLHTKYYNVEEGARRVVKDKIIEMLNVARKLNRK